MAGERDMVAGMLAVRLGLATLGRWRFPQGLEPHPPPGPPYRWPRLPPRRPFPRPLRRRFQRQAVRCHTALSNQPKKEILQKSIETPNKNEESLCLSKQKLTFHYWR